MRFLGTGAAVVTLCLATAAPSLAAKAEVAWGSHKYGGYSILYVTAAPGEHNEIVVTETGGALRVTDSTPVSVGGSCDAQPDGSAICQGSLQRQLTELRIDAGDLDDSVRSEFWNSYLSGGAGNDVLTVTGPASAVFKGGPGDDRMTGGEFRSIFIEDSATNGSDVMMGGSPPGPPGPLNSNEVSYAGRVNPVHADLEGDADDGEAGERDQIGTGVGSITGGAGPDVLTGNAVGNRLVGGYGADLLRSGAGNDILHGGVNADVSTDRLVAGSGADYVTGGGGDDVLHGGLGNDNVGGGPGRDRVRPGPGRDKIAGGPGNDMLWTFDRRGEDVECGGGFDTVLADSFFDSLEDCERDLSRKRRR